MSYFPYFMACKTYPPSTFHLVKKNLLFNILMTLDSCWNGIISNRNKPNEFKGTTFYTVVRPEWRHQGSFWQTTWEDEGKPYSVRYWGPADQTCAENTQVPPSAEWTIQGRAEESDHVSMCIGKSPLITKGR